MTGSFSTSFVAFLGWECGSASAFGCRCCGTAGVRSGSRFEVWVGIGVILRFDIEMIWSCRMTGPRKAAITLVRRFR
jgi:hypothetical protein